MDEMYGSIDVPVAWKMVTEYVAKTIYPVKNAKLARMLPFNIPINAGRLTEKNNNRIIQQVDALECVILSKLKLTNVIPMQFFSILLLTYHRF